MLCRFMNRISHSMSSSVTARPLLTLNSWRLTPRKMIRFPFRSMIPSFISKRRNPTDSLAISFTPPASFRTYRYRLYRFGSSALQALTLGISPLQQTVSDRDFDSERITLPSASFSISSAVPSKSPAISAFRLKTPSVYVSSRLPFQNISITWISGTA